MTLESWHRGNKPRMGKGQVAYATHILPDESCLFVETPKVACSTIKSTLHAIAGVEGREDRKFEEVHQRRKSPLKSFADLEDVAEFLDRPGVFKFCFVRDPYSRTLSAWRDKIARGDSRQRRDLLKQMGEDQDSGREIPFEAFLEVLEGQWPKQMNPHWRVQADQTMQGVIAYDFIGRFERFAEDFTEVLQRIGGEREIETVRPHSTGSGGSLDAEMTDRARRMIQKIFERDFEMFGYRM